MNVLNRTEREERSKSAERALKYLRRDLAKCEKEAAKNTNPRRVKTLAAKHKLVSRMIVKIQRANGE